MSGLLELYTHLHGNHMPEIDGALPERWNIILRDKNHHIIVAGAGGKIIV